MFSSEIRSILRQLSFLQKLEVYWDNVLSICCFVLNLIILYLFLFIFSEKLNDTELTKRNYTNWIFIHIQLTKRIVSCERRTTGNGRIDVWARQTTNKTQCASYMVRYSQRKQYVSEGSGSQEPVSEFPYFDHNTTLYFSLYFETVFYFR